MERDDYVLEDAQEEEQMTRINQNQNNQSINQNKSAEETAKYVKEKLAPYQKEVRASVFIAGQNVRVECYDQTAMSRIKSVIADEMTTLTDRAMLKPQIIMYGISNFVADSFINDINALNDGVLGKCSKLAHHAKNRKDCSRTDVIIELSGRDQTKALELGNLLFGFESYQVYENIQPRQCVTCLEYGHKKDQCPYCSSCLSKGCKPETCKKPKRNICFKCGEDHVRKDCKATKHKCAVCVHHGKEINGKHTRLNANHSMQGRDCPLRALAETQLRRRTDYGQ